MKFKLYFVIAIAIGLHFESYEALSNIESEKRTTLLASQYRQDVHQYSPVTKKNVTNCNTWEKGVYEAYHGCAKVMKRFPTETFEFGETVIESYKVYADELGSLTQCNSTFLSTGCTKTLETVSLISKLGKSPSYLLFQFGKVLSKMSTGFQNIVDSLCGTIGQLVQPINEAITLVENALMTSMTQFRNRMVERNNERCEQIDFEGNVKSMQLLTNTIALIAETALNDCDCVTLANEAYEAISILVFILNMFLIAIQGTNANIATVLVTESKRISPFLNSCFEAIDPFIGGVAEAFDVITFDIAKSMREFLMRFVHLTYYLNDALDEIMGPFQGANITVSQIRSNLMKSQGN